VLAEVELDAVAPAERLESVADDLERHDVERRLVAEQVQLEQVGQERLEYLERGRPLVPEAAVVVLRPRKSNDARCTLHATRSTYELTSQLTITSAACSDSFRIVCDR